MSHHFDTPTAQEDPRINICDFYLFQGQPGTTVMAMTVNPNAGISAPDTFRDEGLYAFRFDLNGDAAEEVTFKILFGEVSHANDEGHEHIQPFKVLRATGGAALRGIDGELVVEGKTGSAVKTDAGVTAYAGLAPDLFAGDGVAIITFLNTFFKTNRYDTSPFLSHRNLFDRQNVTAIILELPNRLIGEGLVHSWATASLYGHAPEVQVSRWGLPLITHIFMPDPVMREDYNKTTPADDITRFAPQISKVASHLAELAGSVANPPDYGKQLVARLCPTTLPYQIGTAAAFDYIGFNGRGLTDDAMDVMLSLITNTALGDGVAPDRNRTLSQFPYFGKPYSKAEQVGVHPDPTLPKK
jgi:uncharacterized protein DUF4331